MGCFFVGESSSAAYDWSLKKDPALSEDMGGVHANAAVDGTGRAE